MTGRFSHSTTTAIATFNIVFASSESGRVPIVQLTTNPSKQSITRKRYTFPAWIWNSVMSVSHFIFDVSAWKSLLVRFSGVGLISPRCDPYRRFYWPQRSSTPSSNAARLSQRNVDGADPVMHASACNVATMIAMEDVGKHPVPTTLALQQQLVY